MTTGAGFPAAAADPVLLARVLAASRVDTRGSSPDASYWRDFLDWLDRATRLLPSWQRLPRGWALWALAGLLAAGALALLVRHRLAARRPRAYRQPDSAGAAVGGDRAGAATDAGSEAWDAAAWRLELDRLLGQGRLAEALGAFWWWLARSLAGPRAEPNWTGRDLLGWSRRDDLRPLIRQLEVMRYGRRQSSIQEIRRLAARLEAALA